jgi:hypothetical protein
MNDLRRLALLSSGLALALAGLVPTAGCEPEGCLGGDEGCIVPSPCQELTAPTCSDESLVLKVIGPEDVVPGGEGALGAVGDVLIGNSRVVGVVDAITNANYFVESGGFLLDLGTVTGGAYDDNDALNQLIHATGVLPESMFVYEDMQLLRGDGFVAVQVTGHLGAGNTQHRVATRYEVRPCEPGIRMRSEIINAGNDDEVWTVNDAPYWGGRQNWGLTPTTGVGFNHPPLSLSDLPSVFKKMDYAAAGQFVAPSASYGLAACNLDQVEGFQHEVITAVGSPVRVVPPGDYVVYERIFVAANGLGLQPATDLTLEVRRQLQGEGYVRLTGRVEVAGGAALRRADRVMLLISQGTSTDPDPLRRPITQVMPNADGAWSARVPAGADYVISAIAFGETVAEDDVSVGDADLDVGALTVPAAGEVRLNVTRIDLRQTESLVTFRPADDETAAARTVTMLDIAPNECAPLLGYPYGDSPACNYVLVGDPVTIDVPPGTYDVFATNGPFATLARQRIEVTAGSTHDVGLSIAGLNLQPGQTLSADLHVHGKASYDTALPNVTRVRSILASGLDVIAATDHEAIADYSETLDALGVTDEVVMMSGVEISGFALFKWNPSVTFPQTVGHWGFWPLEFRDDRPRNGAPQSQFVQPAELFMRMKQAELPEWGIVQLNHPIATVLVGRDYGWMSSLLLDYTVPLPAYDDGTNGAFFSKQPRGVEFRNSDYHTQEVVNGTRPSRLLQNRFVWHWLLNQGVLRTGVANSDSHTLTDNLVGTPRNLVWTQTSREEFDMVTFNQALKRGHAIGTNGPIIDARIVTPTGNLLRPGTAVLAASDESELRVTVTSAPWVPVDEIRFLVNGETVLVVDQQIRNATDPEGVGPLVNWNSTFRLGDLLPGDGGDAWLSVEAGAPLPLIGDLDCDGLPDTTDNNGDDVVDWRDVDRNGDGHVRLADTDTNGDGEYDADDVPPACEAGTGPRELYDEPARDDEAYPFWATNKGGFPYAFTNPFVLDRDGDGFEAPGISGSSL